VSSGLVCPKSTCARTGSHASSRVDATIRRACRGPSGWHPRRPGRRTRRAGHGRTGRSSRCRRGRPSTRRAPRT
jgi:hypothetical protein